VEGNSSPQISSKSASVPKPCRWLEEWRSCLSAGLLMIFVLSALCLTGCGGESAKAGEKETEVSQAAGQSDEDGGSAGALVASDDAKPAEAPIPYTEVNIPAYDGFKLYGRLYDPYQNEVAKAEEAAGEDGQAPEIEVKTQYPLVLLLHSLTGSQNDWRKIPKELVRQGYAVLAIDLRGHGRSVSVGKKGRMSWRAFAPKDWLRIKNDLYRVLRYFANGAGKEDYPQVRSDNAALIGAGLGANMAVLAGADYSERFPAIALLSPGLSIKGVEPSLPMLNYSGAVFMAASQDDEASFNDTKKLYELTQTKKALRLYDKIGSGPDMLRNHPPLRDELIRWLRKEFPPAAGFEGAAPVEKTVVPEASPDAASPSATEPSDPKADTPRVGEPAAMPSGESETKPHAAAVKADTHAVHPGSSHPPETQAAPSTAPPVPAAPPKAAESLSKPAAGASHAEAKSPPSSATPAHPSPEAPHPAVKPRPEHSSVRTPPDKEAAPQLASR
jgi:alpha-beta hydrolase superfamily lysophospholipase